MQMEMDIANIEIALIARLAIHSGEPNLSISVRAFDHIVTLLNIGNLLEEVGIVSIRTTHNTATMCSTAFLLDQRITIGGSDPIIVVISLLSNQGGIHLSKIGGNDDLLMIILLFMRVCR
jgi:hypothetical protein